MNKCLVFGSGSAGIRHAKNAQFLGMEVVLVTQRKVEGFEAYKSFEEAFDKFSPHFGIIANRTSHHLDALRLLVDQNIPALIEKPLTNSFDKCLNELVESVNNQGTQDIYRVAYLMRYHPLVIQLNKDLESLGEINYINSQYGHYLPWWRDNSDYRESYSASRDQGGGVMYDSSHEIDLIQFLFGNINSVSAKLRNFNVLDIDSDELCSLSLELENNIIADISLDYLSKIPTRSFRVEGSKGTAILDFINDNYFISTQDNKEIKKIDMKIDRNDIFITELRDFTQDMKKCILPNITESIKTVQVFDKANNSHE